jgi:NADH-quinone oxidoreductase subunit J
MFNFMWIYYVCHVLVILILFNAIIVIESWNPIFAIYHLIGVFLLTAIFLLIMGAEFLALNLVLLYVGAIAILGGIILFFIKKI